MIIHLSQPLRAKEMMRSRPMSHRTRKLSPMRTSRPNGIEATSTKTPSRNTTHIKLRLLCHIIQHSSPLPISRLWIRRISRRVCRTGNLTDNGRPAAADDLMCPLAVVGPVPVQPGHKQDDRDGVRGARFVGDADVQRDAGSIVCGAVRVWDDHFFDDGIPQRRGLEVELFLAVECRTLDGVVWTCGRAYIGEAGDAQDD